MKIGTKDIKNIKAGSKSTFKCESPLAMNSTKNLAKYVQNTYPENGVKYSVKMDYAKLEITITAIPVENLKKK